MKNTKIKDFASPLKYNSNTLFIIIFMEKNKSIKLGSQKVGEDIASMSLNKFSNYFNYMEKDTIW